MQIPILFEHPNFTRKQYEDVQHIVDLINEKIRSLEFTNTDQIRKYCEEYYNEEWKTSDYLRYFVGAM